MSFLIYNIFQELQLSSKLAVHDVLTNIYNRRYFFNSVESLLSRPVVKDFCVMLVDITQFKQIHAPWGHRVGDKVLVSIVDIFQQRFIDLQITPPYADGEFGFVGTMKIGTAGGEEA